MSTRALRTWLFIHKWSSLVCTLFLLLLCLTGLPLIFAHEIEHATEGEIEAAPMPPGSPQATVDSIVATALLQRPGEFVQFFSIDEDDPNLWYLGVAETPDAPEISVSYTFDAGTGAILHTWTPDELGVMDIIYRLHLDMFAGLPGTLFLGAMGLLFVLAMVSGVVLYAPFMRKLAFGTVRRQKSPRAKWLDLHNLLGIAATLWLVVVGFTGVINTLAIPIFAYWQDTELADMTQAYRDRPVLTQYGRADDALAAARAAAPAMTLDFLAFPGNDFASPHHYVAYMHGATPLTSRLLEPVLIDASSSEVVDQRRMPWYVSALLLSQPLHFGDYGGLPLKILWALLDIIAIVVLGSGVYLWLQKRNIPVDTQLRELQLIDSDSALPVMVREG